MYAKTYANTNQYFSREYEFYRNRYGEHMYGAYRTFKG